MNNFVYVPKKEYLPLKKDLIELINTVQDEVRDYFTFRFDFIGSASRNMITCDYGSNVGFDFDVNIRVNDDEVKYSAKEIKGILIDGFDRHSHKFSYDFAEDSKRVLTIKVKDRTNSRIIHSCDFGIVRDTDDGRQQYIHFNKKQNTYGWNYQPNGFYKLYEKVNFVKKSGYWQELRKLYLDLKNRNQIHNKKSRSIFAESVNNIYTKYSKQKGED